MSRVRNATFAGHSLALRVAVVALTGAAFASAAVDPTLLNLVMPDAKFVSGIHVDSSKNSPFGHYVLSQMQADDPAFSTFIATTGFDPRRDLAEIVAGTAGTSDQPLTLVLGRGTFSPTTIVAAAKAHGATVSNYNGIDIVTHTQSNVQEGALAFLNDGYAAMGNLDAVKGAIDRLKSGVKLPAAIAARATALSNANDAWFLTTGAVTNFFAGKIADPKLDSALQGNLLQAVLRADGGVKFGTSVVFQGEALTRSAKDATALADVVRFLAGLVQLNSGSDPNAQKLASLLDGMTLSTEDATTLLSLSIPESVVEQLFVPSARSGAKARVKRAAAR